MSSSGDISRGVANALFEANEELRATGRRLDRIATILERLTPDVADLRDTFEGTVVHEIRAELKRIAERLAVIEHAVEGAAQASREASAQAFATREATGRVQLTAAGVDKSGTVKSIARAVFSAPVTKILAVAVLVFSLVVGAGVAIAVYQEVRAIRARMGG
jgi:hypothetical protein